MRRNGLHCGCGSVLPLAWSSVTLLSLAGCSSTHLLTVDDVVCRPGDKARLIGKLEYRGVAPLHTGLDDRRLRFYVDGEFVGEDESNDDGYARIKRRFESVGRFPFELSYEDRLERVHRAEAAVYVWDRESPVLVVDIDETVAQTRKRYLLSNGPDRSRPLPGAVEVLSELAVRFRIVYLTARPRDFAAKTRRWLMDNRFPDGPVLTWDVDEYEFSATEYKEDRLDDLTDEFEHVTIGVGNAESDHNAYRKRKLLTILIDPEQGPHHLDCGVSVPGWAAVRELFEANPQLYDRELSNDAALHLAAGPS